MIAVVIIYASTGLAKRSIGRLRPRFLAVCRPNVDLDACATLPLYIHDYNCTNPNIDEVMDTRVSFYSGHAVDSMVAAMFSSLYIHARLSRTIFSHAVIPLLQFGIIGSSLFIGWSRWVDHSHHWSDVVIGQIVGAVIAWLIVKYVAKMFKLKKISGESKSQTP
uniref:Phosphatidic acid phosphatase type 2/haloperoxidase domain-containing protein n=1 Tax=Panagrolaimus sp. JU765 TaxID=591449 RepID=A0AC34R085_9BILA